MADVFDELVEEHPAWWIDVLGQHNHIGGFQSTEWLLERVELNDGDWLLDAGAFVGATARLAAERSGARAVATDLTLDFLSAGGRMSHGDQVHWSVAASQNLPFRDGAFQSVWCLDSYLAPAELSRVSAPTASLALCCEVPVDGRGGMEAFSDEWAEYGWQLAAHREISNDATVTWRKAEADLVRRRPHFQERYGDRGYAFHLDILADLVMTYERREQGHGLFVFKRDAQS